MSPWGVLKHRGPMPSILSLFKRGKGRSGEAQERLEDDDLTEEQKLLLFQRVTLSKWRRSATPALEEMDALKYLLPRMMTREHFTVIDNEQMNELSGVLESSGSVSAYLRRFGLSLPFPRNDVAMSLIWLACGEGDALARLWMIDALARALVEDRAEDPVAMLALFREHLSLLGLGSMGFDDGSVRHFVRTVMVGPVTQAARKGAPEHGRMVEHFLDGLLALRLYPGWRTDFDAVLASIGVVDPRREPVVPEDDFTATISSDRMPEPPLKVPEQRTGYEMRVVAEGFVAEKAMKRFGVLQRPLPLLLGRDLDTLREDLLDEFPWMPELVDKIVNAQSLRMRGDSPWFTLPPLLLVGPPGTGKTRFAGRLAQRVGIPIHRINAAGRGGAVELLGHSPTYRDAHPSAPVTAIANHACANPMLLVDEVEKFGTADYNGDPRDALVAMLGRETARAFHDDNLRVDVDISQISFVFTANSTDGLKGPLLDRLAVFEIRNPPASAFDGLLEATIDQMAREVGLARAQMPSLAPEAVAALRRAFGKGQSIRVLQKAVQSAIESASNQGIH